MREILFRGFTPSEKGKTEIIVDGKSIKGEWVQGSYWKLEKTTYCFKEDYDAHPDNTEHYIVFSQITDWGLPNQQLKADVIPETVGQYTGLTDKNGKRIFEGDICQTKGFPLIDDKPFVVEWNDDECSFYWRDVLGTDEFNIGVSQNTTIVGNVHDNPELLKGGTE